MKLVRMTDEEQRRILAEETRGAFDLERIRVLVPTAGGPNAIEAARIALTMGRRSNTATQILFVDVVSRWWQRATRLFRRSRSGEGIEEHTKAIREMAGEREPKFREVRSSNVAQAILGEATRGIDLILIGAAGTGAQLGGKLLEDLVADAPCHVGIVRAGKPSSVRRVLVPVDGSIVSRIAAEFAIAYCEQAEAELVVGVLVDRSQPETEESGVVAAPEEPSPREQIERVTPLFKVSRLEPHVVHIRHDATHNGVLDELDANEYEFVVLGVENRAIRHRMFFGYENERLIRKAKAGIVVVIPDLSRVH
jgi:hypothetical protein